MLLLSSLVHLSCVKCVFFLLPSCPPLASSLSSVSLPFLDLPLRFAQSGPLHCLPACLSLCPLKSFSFRTKRSKQIFGKGKTRRDGKGPALRLFNGNGPWRQGEIKRFIGNVTSRNLCRRGRWTVLKSPSIIQSVRLPVVSSIYGCSLSCPLFSSLPCLSAGGEEKTEGERQWRKENESL